MLPAGVARSVAQALAGAVFLFALTSCGGEEGGDGTRPTISPTRTSSATLPSPTRTGPDRTESPEPPSPTRTEEPTEEPTDGPTEEPTEEPTGEPVPTRSADRTETPDEPATQESSVPPDQTPTSQTATTTPSETGNAAGEDAEDAEDAEDEGIPTWAWWVLAALLLGSAVAIPLVVQARRRNAWRQALAEAEGELAWLARELLPGLRRSGSLEQVTGGWAVGRARVTAAEDRLTVLESSAPDDVGRERARSLRDASRRAQADMDHLTGPGPHDTWALDLDAVIDDLEVALRPLPDAAGPPPTPAG